MMEILIIFDLTLLNGIFSMSEMSLVSSRKFKLESERKKGSNGAKTALELSENPTKFLSTVQIGITLIGILLGVYGGENLTQGVEETLLKVEILRPFAHNLAVGLTVLFITYISIVLGELFPKRLGLTFPEPIAVLLSRPMKVLSKITSPFVWLLTSTNDLLLMLFGISKTMDDKVSEEEIKSLVKESADGGEIQEIEQEIVERVFELGDRKVNSLLTHKNDIVYFDENENFQEVLSKISIESHSVYPVCSNDDINAIVGVVYLKELILMANSEQFDLKQAMKKPLFINENANAYKLLEKIKSEKVHFAVVIDEYGNTLGIITLSDIINSLVGNIGEMDQADYNLIPKGEKTWLADGQYPFLDFLKFFKINSTTDYTTSEYVTLAGFFLDKFGNIPTVGDTIDWNGFTMEVIDKDKQRIDKILISKT
jgi:putative hemolysin